MISSYTGSTSLTLVQDNGASMRINGVELVSNFPIDSVFTNTVTYNLVASQAYDIEIDWVDYGGPGGITLKWDIGAGSVAIPAERFAIKSDVGSSPVQISVACPGKYEQVPSTTDQ
mmetsp:Transcript_8990/g.8549  ORF Transcript_8990/g.8549 Transcript_8990/m.8549 type:complete len:116 (+) Transcript_8990:367-714(+)